MREQAKGALWLTSLGALMGVVFGVIIHQGTGRLELAWAIGAGGAIILGFASFVAAWRSYAPPPTPLLPRQRRARLLVLLLSAMLIYLVAVGIAVFPALRGHFGISLFIALVVARIIVQLVLSRPRAWRSMRGSAAETGLFQAGKR